MQDIEKLKYPIGKFQIGEVTEEDIKNWIKDIKKLPKQLKKATKKYDEAQLDTPYRPEGWTVRQVIHHIADSHINAYTRFKLALTEENPTIRPYEEQLWAEIPEAKTADIQLSLDIIKALHKRWAMMLKNMDATQWERTYFHPASKQKIALKHVLGMYSWHGRHHLAHVESVKG